MKPVPRRSSRNRKVKLQKHLKWGLLLFCVFTLITYWVISLHLHEFPNNNCTCLNSIGGNISKSEIVGSSKEKLVILMWSNYYEHRGTRLLRFIHSGRKWDSSCCVGPDAEVTLDRGRLPEAAAVVIYGYFGSLNKRDLPAVRRQDQLWILFLKESPMYSPGLTPFNSMFNWTMSYRRDSDIWVPYGEYMEKESKSKVIRIRMEGGVTLDKWVKNKRKLFVGVSSNCRTPSRREKLWRALRNKSLPVDMFGDCGKRICNRRNTSCNHNKFWTNLGKQYKFYFAAENSLCVDYITEKFWRTLDVGMVPVVYGGANYSELAPPNSFIDARDFSSPAQLARFLLRLDKNPAKYKKYFQWRSKFKLKLGDGWSGWCDLCRKVREFRENGTPPSESKNFGRLQNLSSHDKRACVKPPFSL